MRTTFQSILKLPSRKFWQDILIDMRIKTSPILNLENHTVRSLIEKKGSNYTIWVPLNSITTFIKNENLLAVFEGERVRKPNIQSFFWPGDWDTRALSIEPHYMDESLTFRSVYQIMIEGKHYKECDEYKQKASLIEDNGRSARGSTIGELNAYFERLVQVSESVIANGYKSQKDLGDDPDDEIGVFIGRNGEIIKPEDKFSGTHRFAIAKFAGVVNICVQILAVHDKWADRHLQLLTGSLKKLEQHFN